MLYDHLELERAEASGGQPSDGGPTRKQVGELYRALRLNLQPARQEIEAGHFYVGQMDMRRGDREEFGRGYTTLMATYRAIALYGESWLRPLILYGLLGLAFAFVYLRAGFKGVDDETLRYVLAFHLPDFGDYIQALAHALSAGGILQQEFRTLSWWAPVARYVNAFLDIFLVALFVIALRRQFRR